MLEFFSALLSIIESILELVGKYLHGKKYIYRKQVNFDKHFVDRMDEEKKLHDLIYSGNPKHSENVVVISGKKGIGKTSLCRKICDDINYHDRNHWKRTFAIYYPHNNYSTIEKGILSQYTENEQESISRFSRNLHFLRFAKYHILFIDNINAYEYYEAYEFAKAFCNSNRHNYVILAVDDDRASTFSLKSFHEEEIKMLCDSFKLKLQNEDICNITDESNGLPVYARYIVYSRSLASEYDALADIQLHAEHMVNALSDDQKQLLAIILLMCKMIPSGVELSVLVRINPMFTSKGILRELITLPVVELQSDSVFFCMEGISDFYLNEIPREREEAYKQIYNTFEDDAQNEGIVLYCTLHSNMKINTEKAISLLHSQYKKGNVYHIIDAGNKIDGINLNLMKERAFRREFFFCFAKSLLAVGAYRQARGFITDKDIKNDMTYLTIGDYDDRDFDYQYCIVDINHLTNHFDEAVDWSNILLNKAKTEQQKHKCLYMQAHCMRHMGKDLPGALQIFNLLAYNKAASDEIRIRSLYSVASIRMFFHDSKLDAPQLFQEIDRIISRNEDNRQWIPYVTRHKAIYEAKRQNYEKAEKLLIGVKKKLETRIQRIKYDIDFELAEVYRLKESSKENYQKSYVLYTSTTKFAKQEQDYNLETNCLMGMHLLALKYSKPLPDEHLDIVAKELEKNNMEINRQSALFIMKLEKAQAFGAEQIRYWNKMGYMDLYDAAHSYKSYQLKLTVM